MKSGDGKSQRREEKKKEDQRREIQKKEDPGARKGRKVAIHSVFPKICGSGGSKSRLAKAAGAEPCGQMRDKELHAVVAWITFASEKAKNTARSEHFWKLWCRKSAKHIPKSKCTNHTILGPLVEKVHAVVARSTFRSQNAQNTPRSDHFWKWRCRKTARRCGAKHISKLKVEKTEGFGALFQVEMSKKCTPLWCKPYFQVKSGKNWRVRSTFEFRFRFAWPAQGIVRLVKSEQNVKVL